MTVPKPRRIRTVGPEEPPGGPTVREALDLPVLRRGLPKVVTGRNALDRPIRWVHSSEVSNIAMLLTGGEMLLTTGMGIGHSAHEQSAFVAALAPRRIAALVIELGEVFAELPRALVDAAAAHDVPVIALRRPVPFVEVAEAVHTRLVSSEYAALRRAEEVHRTLTSLMLDGEGVPGVIAAVAEVLRGPVFLEGADRRLLFHAAPAGAGDDPLAIRDALSAQPGSSTWSGVIEAEVQMGGHQAPGRLVLVTLESTVDPAASLVLQHAAGIVALALMRARQEDELLARERGNLLVDLSDGRISPQAAERVAGSAGMAPAKLILPIAAALQQYVLAGKAERAILLGDLDRRLRGRGLNVLLGFAAGGDCVVALAGVRSGDDRETTATVVADELRRVVARRFGAGDVAIAVGLAGDWVAAGPGLRLASECAASALALPPVPWHDIAALELPRLLWRWRDDEELTAFVQRTLGPLIDHDRQRRLNLLPTLEVLLETGMRKAEAARILHSEPSGALPQDSPHRDAPGDRSLELRAPAGGPRRAEGPGAAARGERALSAKPILRRRRRHHPRS